MDSIKDYFPLVQLSTRSILQTDKVSKQIKQKNNILYTSDIHVELPIFMTEQGNGSIKPITIMELFDNTVKKHNKEDALFVERNGIWQSWTWNHYHKEVIHFAKALINIGIDPYKTVNILGHNSPEWFTSFLGGIHACVVPVGIYNTNNTETCVYIGEHSEVGCLVLDSLVQFRKYEKELSKFKHLKAVVFYCQLSEIEMKSLINPHCSVFIWDDFIELGKKATVELELNNRIKMQRPGNCCNIVYTSGTTGFPKAVILSHDNLTWSARSLQMSFGHIIGDRHKMISFLPLSHIAGQMIDIIMSILSANYIYFAKSDALSGSLTQTISNVKPTAFFAVPRVYEKFQEKIKEVIYKTTGIKRKIAKWSMKVGSFTVDKSFEGEQPSVFFKLANYLVFSKIRLGLGFENTKIFSFGAAPLKKSTVEFYKSINIPLFNNYGLSETTGPHFVNFGDKHVDLFSAGITISGSDSKIINQDKDGVGEICCRGRNRFMGYYKDIKSTEEAIDQDGFLHSGDQGYFNSKGNLIITGRIKELIVTAGGENVAPLPIEDAIKEICKFISNVIVIGDERKYLTALITLKSENNGNLSPESLEEFKLNNIDCKTSIDAMNDNKVKTIIQGIIDNINKKAISKAQIVKKWMILPQDFSLDGGELTPTLKLKRKYVVQKYAKEIEKMYSLPKY